MITHALAALKRGWYVFPCNGKIPIEEGGFKTATNDEAKVREWWTAYPKANPGVWPGGSLITSVDIDTGLTNETSLREFCARYGLPETFALRTGKRPQFRVQLIFSGNTDSFNKWQVDEFAGDVRGSWGHIMAPGSIHPESGAAYEILWDKPLSPLPEWVRNLQPVRKQREIDPTAPIVEWRNDTLYRVLCKHRSNGADDEMIRAFAYRAVAQMPNPLDDEEVERVITNALKQPIGLPEAIPVLSTVAEPVEVDTSQDADDLDDSPRPRYPDEVWQGTFYGEFAELCTRDNFIPKKFFSESMRTVVGAVVGDRLRCPITGVNPRAYTIKIAPPGSGKGTSDERIRDFFSTERWDGLERTEAPLLWTSATEYIWRGRGLGAQAISPASAPGLIMAIEARKLKKGETANPLETWKPMPRVITMSEEVRSLFANFANESTGAGLESVLCELFDRDSFTATATKDRGPASGKLMYSLLGGITKDGWDSVFSKVESVESGFLSRVNIVGTEEDRTKAGLKAPDFGPLRARFFPFLQDLERTVREIDATPSAMSYMDRWYSRLALPEGVSRARLNIHAWRTALHLAWLRGHESILDEDVDGGIQVAAYLAKMREFYAPPEGETRQARCEASIRKVVRGRRKISVRELRRKTNYTRWGLGLWDKALQALTKAGEMRLAEGEKGKVMVILLKSSD